MTVNFSTFLMQLNRLEQVPEEKNFFYSSLRSSVPLKALFDKALTDRSWVLQHEGLVVEAINAIYPIDEASEKVMALSYQTHQISLNSFLQMFSLNPIDITERICRAIRDGNFLEVAHWLGQEHNLLNIDVERIISQLQFFIEEDPSKLFYQTLENIPCKEKLKELFFARNTKHDSTPLVWALDCGHYQVAEFLVRSCGENQDLKKILFQQPQKLEQSHIRYSILGALVLNNKFDLVRFLLESCGDDRDLKKLLFQPFRGVNPLHFAVINNSLEISRILFESCEDDRGLKQQLLFQIDNKGTIPLFVAIENNNLAIVKVLLESCGDDRDLKKQLLLQPYDEGGVPLYIAIKNNNLAIVKVLLEFCGDDRDLKKLLFKPFRGGNPLHFAVIKNSLEISRILVESCVDDLDSKSYLLFDPDNYKWNLLLVVIENKNFVMLKMLLEFCGYTRDLKKLLLGPLSRVLCCAENNRFEINRILLNYCRGDQDLKEFLLQPDESGYTPFDHAVDLSNYVMVQIMLESCGGELKQLLFQSKNNPMVIAVKNQSLRMVEFLLDACGYDQFLKKCLFQPDNFGKSPLIWAVHKNNLKITQTLLDSCITNSSLKNLLLEPDCSGLEPLDYARPNNLIMVQTLLETRFIRCSPQQK